jgi:hypothetical protein
MTLHKTMKTAKWILLVLVLLAGGYGLVILYGPAGYLLLFLFAIVLFFGLDRLNRWRSNRLARSKTAGETVVASGLVRESSFDQAAAVVVRGARGHYRILVADSRGSQTVQSVAPILTHHSNAFDRKSYVEFRTDQGLIHFAPANSFLVFGQPDYAQKVLNSMLADGLRPAADTYGA